MPVSVTPSGAQPMTPPVIPVYPGPPVRNDRGTRKLVLAGGGGVLALALVVTAVIVLAPNGSNGNPDNPTTSSLPSDSIPPSPPSDVFPNAAEQELLSDIPPFVKGSCQRPENSTLEQAVGVACYPNSTITVEYYQFTSTQEMDNMFDILLSDRQLQSATCDPDQNATFSAQGTWGDPVVGRFACDFLGSIPWIGWTHDPTDIYSYAVAVDEDEQAAKRQLYDFYIDAGPY